MAENSLKNPGVSVFFPAFNDAGSIGKLVADAAEILHALAEDFEIIVVNDGSTDETANVLNDLRKRYDFLRVVQHETNKGYGAALRSGFGAAKNDLVFYTDGDGQYDVREMPELFARLDEKTDVVNGYKLGRADKKRRKLLGGFYNRLAHLLFSLPVRDVDCDFRLIRREFLEKITLLTTSGSICVELVYKLSRAGARFAEVGVSHYERPFGRSQFFTARRVAATLRDFFALWFNLVVLRKNR
jgi:glycosyltransferase involved in cell wall biosynthesis